MNPTRALIEAAERAQTLLRGMTINAVMERGIEAINAAGLSPYCVNEGRATGKERISTDWLEAAISSAKAAEEGVETIDSVVCKECDGPMEWHLLCIHCGHTIPKPMPEFDEKWEALLAQGCEVEPSPEEEGFARWGWNACKAVVEVREKEGL